MNEIFTKEQVDKYANDLLISLSDEENKMVLDEFAIIKENMDKINELADIDKEEALTHPFWLNDVLLREDEVKEELSVTDVLKNTDYKTMEEIIVPKEIENE